MDLVDSERQQVLWNLETAYVCGTVGEAKQAIAKAHLLEIPEDQIQRAIQKGQKVMQAIIAAHPEEIGRIPIPTCVPVEN